jgi:hypothetical protein
VVNVHLDGTQASAHANTNGYYSREGLSPDGGSCSIGVSPAGSCLKGGWLKIGSCRGKLKIDWTVYPDRDPTAMVTLADGRALDIPVLGVPGGGEDERACGGQGSF